MLDISLRMNSPVEDILAFRTCCNLKMFDQNLEVLVTNRGPDPVIVPSYFDLQEEGGFRHRVNTLVPPGEHRIKAGEIMAFYCYMDEDLWNRSLSLVFYDRDGNEYPVEVVHNSERG
ncbi:MAG: hypothetical protein WBG50_07715 [Desulfomonilaceae bacterium]